MTWCNTKLVANTRARQEKKKLNYDKKAG
jgi:hypothetical protein